LCNHLQFLIVSKNQKVVGLPSPRFLHLKCLFLVLLKFIIISILKIFHKGIVSIFFHRYIYIYIYIYICFQVKIIVILSLCHIGGILDYLENYGLQIWHEDLPMPKDLKLINDIVCNKYCFKKSLDKLVFPTPEYLNHGYEDICSQHGWIHELGEPHTVVMNTLNNYRKRNNKVNKEWQEKAISI
jgi:hypothetical protein